MGSGYYNGIAGLVAADRAQEIVAQNLANSGTTGYKAARPFVEALELSLAASPGDPPRVVGEGRDWTPGALRETGRPLDLALEGRALLAVQTPAGERYTRDGRLSLDPASGSLVTLTGDPVVGESGAIVPGEGTLELAADGRVLANGVEVGKLKLVEAGDPASLAALGAGLYAAPGPLAAAPGARLRPGFVEQSNVDPVRGTITLIQALRSFEAIERASQLLMGDMAKALYEESGRPLAR